MKQTDSKMKGELEAKGQQQARKMMWWDLQPLDKALDLFSGGTWSKY
jgi:hypothetical protein